MRLLLLAAPGAGKGTQARRLSEIYGIEHISSGELLRRAVAEGTTIGAAAAAYLERGDLVPDNLIFDLILDRVIAASARGGYILDGFPRNRKQAEEARRVAVQAGVGINAAIYIHVTRDESMRRLLGRSSLEGRADDQQAIIEHRIEVFERETLPLIDFYDSLGLLVRINGEQPVDRVTEDIVERLSKSVLPSSLPLE
jgi:adenylate kinase